MARPSKGLTWGFKLRTTDDEEQMVRDLVAEYAEAGVRLSLNDAVRLLIRQGAEPLPDSRDAARQRLQEHRAECDQCTDLIPRCPAGKRLLRLMRIFREDAGPAVVGVPRRAAQGGSVAPVRAEQAPAPALRSLPAFLGGPGSI